MKSPMASVNDASDCDITSASPLIAYGSSLHMFVCLWHVVSIC